MMSKKIGIGTDFRVMIGIGRIEIDAMIIDKTIGIMITEGRMIIAMTTIQIIVAGMTVIIRQQIQWKWPEWNN